MGDVKEALANTRTWVVLGVSEDPQRWGNRIFRSLLHAGYDVHAVGIRGGAVEGRTVHRAIADVPLAPDARAEAVCDFVLPPPATDAILRQAHALGYRKFWMQPGAEHMGAAEWAAAQPGTAVVHHDCILQHQKSSWV